MKFVCLEGNENGTYFRGRARLIKGEAAISIPHEWFLVSEPDGITVQVTALGVPAILYVAEQSRERIVVRGEPDWEFNYVVNGVRRGFANYEPYTENRAHRPEVRGVPYGTQYPQALREILVQNGVLNADFTPNEATAAALDWPLKDPADVPVLQRWWLPIEERLLLQQGER